MKTNKNSQNRASATEITQADTNKLGVDVRAEKVVVVRIMDNGSLRHRVPPGNVPARRRFAGPPHHLTSELPKPSEEDKEKVAAIVHLRQETTMTLKWIADRLKMGHWTSVSNLVATKPKSK